MTFPAWMIATIVTGFGVWAVAQYSEKYAWYLSLLIVLGVLIFRPNSLIQLRQLMTEVSADR